MPPQSPSGLLFEKHMKTVCITANDDGSFAVYLEAPEMEGMEGEMEMPEEAGESFGSMDEALNAAASMLGGTGEEEQPMIEGEEDLQASFEGGFKQARGM